MLVALTLGVLLLGSLALAEDARGSDSPFITFEKEELDNGGKDPKYLEGEDVVIKIDPTVVQEGDELEVACVEGCPSGISYTHTFTEEEANPAGDDDGDATKVVVVFADGQDFPLAEENGEPAWTGRWQVSLDGGAHTRSFWTFLVEDYDIPTDHYEPAMVTTFQASGYDQGTPVNFSVYHNPEDHPRTLVWTQSADADFDGQARAQWFIPPSVASYLDCPAVVEEECRQFALEVDPVGGDNETDLFQIDPATLLVDEDRAGNPVVTNRTEEIETPHPLYYEGSDLQGNPHYLAPVPLSGDTTNITMYLQRLPDTCGSGSQPENVTTVTARWHPSGYVANFTPPRDFTLETAGSDDQFRWAVAKQEDAYGNEIPYQTMTCFDIEPYKLVPTVHDVPEVVERKNFEEYILNFTYADGTPLKAGENATQLEGALVPVDDGDSTVNEIDILADHLRGGLWVWTHRLPKDFEDLGAWRFEFQGEPAEEQQDSDEGTKDQWGNHLLPNETEPFPVEPASPRISVTTSVDGESRNATRGFDRGDDVSLIVETTYPDGASLNSSDLHPDVGPKLPVDVIRRDESGDVTQVTALQLEELDPIQGSWHGTFSVPKVSAGAPLGTWDIEVSVKDNVTTPNENTSRFPREVHPDTLQVSTLEPPSRKVKAGQQLTWAFIVRDGDGERVTDERTGDRQSGTITVDVRTWENGKPGEFVTTGLEPNFDPNRGAGAWVLRWTPPKDLDPGHHLFSPNGTDIYGNPLAERARSRPFDVSIQQISRDTIVSPPLTVERGSNVTVIFDGRTGDKGHDGAPNPKIRVERQVEDGRWVVEEEDVYRENRTGAGDHLGTWSTVKSTPRDTYRFHLQGRAPDGSIIDATSDTFDLRPQDVTRSVVEPLVPFAKKGKTVTAVVSHKPHDTLHVSDIRISGPQNITDAAGERDIDVTRENWTVSWTIPVTVPDGEYVMHLEGKDQFRNNITATLGPVRVGSVNLTVEPLRLPPPEMPRNEQGQFVFRVTYPDDTLMKAGHGTPDAVITQGGTAIEEANLTFDGVNWHARYTPAPDAPLTTYRFEVGGTDKAANPIRSYSSRPFEVVTGTVSREVREGPPEALERLSSTSIKVEASPDDEFVEFQLEHYGSRHPDQVPGAGPPDPEFTGRLPHEWRPSLGAYQVDWVPPADQDTGWYRIVMKGQDAQGNELEATTKFFQVETTVVRSDWLDEIEEVQPGAERTYRLKLVYPNGDPMSSRHGEPLTFVRLNGRPVEPQPEVAYDESEEIWKVRWSFPNDLPPGSYQLLVRGSDVHDNTILRDRTPHQSYEPGTISQLTGATVPAPGPALAALAAAVTAAAYGRVLSRR